MAAALVHTMTGEKVISHLPIDDIVVGNRHRNAFGDIAELAASIKTAAVEIINAGKGGKKLKSWWSD